MSRNRTLSWSQETGGGCMDTGERIVRLSQTKTETRLSNLTMCLGPKCFYQPRLPAVLFLPAPPKGQGAGLYFVMSACVPLPLYKFSAYQALFLHPCPSKPLLATVAKAKTKLRHRD
jgi:hypothetical protein